MCGCFATNLLELTLCDGKSDYALDFRVGIVVGVNIDCKIDEYLRLLNYDYQQ